ncbi:MAG: membrane protein [Candidatus Kentron sp. G]|nr:MAG: membrane protein [Candidatus Kentron sp. G]VFN04720.1 MAG: membrane protein [Candidatus Kentron sp. G]VFN06808.1 MAG: membrane protein [Candidatus Kentron sp. G]
MKLLRQPQRITDFPAYLFHHFTNDRCPESAGALAYISLLSLVPLMSVGFTLFTAFPAFEGFTEKVQNFIFSNLVPASEEAMKEHMRNFVEKASALTLPGLIALLITALLSMAAIERTFNTIWKVRRRRNPIETFVIYWAVLTVGPILIGVSLMVTSYIASLPFFSDAANAPDGPGILFRSLPFLATAPAFALLYGIVPYQRVPIRHAVAGGILAAALFELAKKGFTLFVTYFSTYQTIYGALATLPIFLIWIYLSWLVTLFGAEFTYCLSHPNPGLDPGTPVPEPAAREPDREPESDSLHWGEQSGPQQADPRAATN